MARRLRLAQAATVAAAAAGILLGEDHAGTIYNAAGPAAITAADRASLLSEITGKPMRFVALNEAALRGGMAQARVPEQYIDALIDIEKRFVAGDFNIVTGDNERLAGRKPQPFRTVLSKQMA
jgi:NAD(P)H dehydrogenase (quinone)